MLFIRDSAHLLSYSPEAQLSNAAENEPSQFIAYPMEVPLENSTGLICGYFDFGSDQQHPVLQQFRDCLVITKAQQIGAIKSLVQSIISESHLGAHANDVILSRLSEVFFLALLRQLAESPTTEMGLFYALQDPKMAMVLQHMYRQIGAPWTLESLAASGGYSRASFVSYFNRYLNQAPLAFLTHLRLTQAKKQLQRGDTVIKVALDVGYQSDVSFAKAYKRYFGIGPGADRL